MITPDDVVLILLAAGKSERFGDIGSKLDQPFLGKPLGAHVAVALEDMPFRKRIAIVDGCTVKYGDHGFEVLRNDDPARDMASSVRIGIEAAKTHDAKAVLIALADMPRVTATHIYHLLGAVDGPDAVVASSDGEQPKPPAVFGYGQFDFLLTLDGDTGARDLVRAGRHVVTNAHELIDVDTPEELEQLRELVNAPEATFTRGRPIRGGARRSG